MSDILRIEGLSAGYGEAIVLSGIDLSVAEGEALAVLGRNGMGKTTLINSIVGVTRQFGGRILLDGKDIIHMPPERRAHSGIGWVPQERNIFRSLTVEENLTAVARPGPWTLKKIYEFFPRLEERRGNLGNALSGGEQQMLAIARALMTNPNLLLLDEPFEGLAPIVAEELTAAIRQMIGERVNAFVLVEQHVEIALLLTQTVIVLERGRIVHRGQSAELLADHTVLERLIGLRLADA